MNSNTLPFIQRLFAASSCILCSCTRKTSFKHRFHCSPYLVQFLSSHVRSRMTPTPFPTPSLIPRLFLSTTPLPPSITIPLLPKETPQISLQITFFYFLFLNPYQHCSEILLELEVSDEENFLGRLVCVMSKRESAKLQNLNHSSFGPYPSKPNILCGHFTIQYDSIAI